MYASTGDSSPAAERIFNQNQAFWWDAARTVEDDFTFPLHEEAPRPRKQRSGKTNKIRSEDGRGTYIRAVPAAEHPFDIAIDATLRTAAIHQPARRQEVPAPRPALIIRKQDLMEKVRVKKTANLMIFLVDLSWSMAVTQRMKAAKGAILNILTSAYQNRDRVALITFQKETARVVIPPTHSVMLAERSMKDVPIGGKTPLAAGLLKAYEMMSAEKKKDPFVNMTLILLTDGDGNVPLANGGDPKEDSRKAAERIASDGFRSVVINTEQITFDQGYANLLAKQLNAPCHLIANIRPDSILRAAREA